MKAQATQPEPMPPWLNHTVLRVDTTYRDLTDADLHLYLVRGRDSVALIDAGIPSTTSRAHAAITATDLSDVRIDQLFITHGHEDHFAGAATWRDPYPDIRLVGPLVDAAWIESHERTMRELRHGQPGVLAPDAATDDWLRGNFWGDPVRLDVLVRDGDVFELGGAQLVAIETGGHSPGHTAYLETQSATLFSGDVVQGEGLTSLSGRSVLPPLYMDVDGYRAGLRRLEAAAFDILAPAHTPPIPRREALEFIRASLLFVDDVEALVHHMVGESDVLTTADVALAIGTELGAFGGISLNTAYVADAHLRHLAKTSDLRPAWVAPDDPSSQRSARGEPR